MNKVELAVNGFKDNLDCAQALLSTYGPDLGLDREIALKVADGFSGGLGRTGETCGAVTGALMVIGLKCGENATGKPAVYRKVHGIVREFIGKFTARNGSIVCGELLGCDISDHDVLNSEETRTLFKTACPQYVRDAAVIIEELLGIS